MNDRGLRKTRSRFCFASVINRMVDLIAHKLNSTRSCELVQAVQFRIANGGAGGIVRAVHQNQLCISVRKFLDLFDIDTESVLLTNGVVARLKSKRLRQGGKSRKA